jgi:hypothetical protein
MYARTGRKDLFDWGDQNARHIADVDHCHYVTKEFVGLPYPRGKLVGGICDYKGFVHWASGARLHYNSAADAMLHHYYFTGDERSRTAALEHGAAMLADGKPLAHREGSGRATSACALYYYTWDNDYLDFLERTVDTLLGTQKEDGSFPQWEDFSPYLQRYVDLTKSRRGMQAMAGWADAACATRAPRRLYGGKIAVLAHAYLYTGDEKYLRTAAYRVHASVDNQYFGEDPRYRGMFIVGHSNLDQSYFMQWMPYYLAAVAKRGGETTQDCPERTWIRTHDRVGFDETTKQAWLTEHSDAPEKPHLWRARFRQEKGGALALTLDLRGYAGQRFMGELQALASGRLVRAFHANPKHLTSGQMRLGHAAEDGATEFELRVFADRNFSVRVPISYGMRGLREVYPVFGGGTMVGDGFRYFFSLPDDATDFTIRYQGRAWPLRMQVYAPSGACVAEDTWIGSNTLHSIVRQLRVSPEDSGHEGWSFRVSGYGQAGLLGFDIEPASAQRPLFFALGADRLFIPSR